MSTAQHHGVPWHHPQCYCMQCKAQWQAAWELCGALRSQAPAPCSDFDIFGDDLDLYDWIHDHD